MREAVLWASCAAIVAIAHIGAGLILATPSFTVDSDAGSPVVTLELSPIVTAPAPPLDDAQPAAEANSTPAEAPGAPATAPPPRPPQDPPKQDRPPDAASPSSESPPPVADQAPVASDPLPAPAPVADPSPSPPQPHLTHDRPLDLELPTNAPGSAPAPPPSASSASSNHVADVTAAPIRTPGSENAVSAPVLRRWQQDLIARIERNKRFPAVARGHEGVVRVAFSIDDEGKLMSVTIASSSGSAILDEAAIDLIRRAQPFPPPPARLDAGERAFVAPIRYLAPGAR